jgi:nucleoside-diphosphate-sugar epimerase
VTIGYPKNAETRGPILITGSAGLIGSAMRASLTASGHRTVGLDLKGDAAEQGDVRDADRCRTAVQGCRGIVHFAAVSRVIFGERDPESCWAINVNGLAKMLGAATEQDVPPWFVFASSREVYGRPTTLPATENSPLQPVNVYGRSKVEGESLVGEAGATGLRTAIIRLSNVYGRIDDHSDRVVPAFARAAAFGGEMRVDGACTTFDFTHVDDIVSAARKVIDILDLNGSPPLPPIHLVTGKATTLWQLAELANRLGSGRSSITEGPSRTFDVPHFVGSGVRARELLGWTPEITLTSGIQGLIDDFRTGNCRPRARNM